MPAALVNLFRCFVLELVLAIPFGALGWVTAGVVGAAASVGVQLFALFILSYRLEAIVARLHDVATDLPPGLLRSLSRVVAAEGGENPEIRVIPDPSPNALVAGSLNGGRTIYVTQGLLALLTETELRAVLVQCLRRARAPGVVLRTLSAILTHGLLSLAPAEWVEVTLTGSRRGGRLLAPLRALGFLVVYPIAAWLVRAGGEPHKPWMIGNDWADAARKIDAQVLRWGMQAPPGTLGLYLFYPWSRRNVLPFPCIPGRTGLNPSG